jgi:hypothetical protein
MYSLKYTNLKAESLEITINKTFKVGFIYVPILILNSLLEIEPDVDKIAIGYVMNDDAISYLKEIKDIYRSFEKIKADRKLPSLEFPLSKFKKSEIVKSLPFQYLKEITFCEGIEDNCGTCPTCRRWKTLEEDGFVIDFDINDFASPGTIVCEFQPLMRIL